MRKARKVVSCAAMQLAMWLVGARGYSAEVSVIETPRDNGSVVVVKRGDDTAYERFQVGDHVLYRFYWDSKIALKVLVVGGKATVQQAADVPVSYSVCLNEHQHPSLVVLEDRAGNIVDGLMQKPHNGKALLMPIDQDEAKKALGHADPAIGADSR